MNRKKNIYEAILIQSSNYHHHEPKKKERKKNEYKEVEKKTKGKLQQTFVIKFLLPFI